MEKEINDKGGKQTKLGLRLDLIDPMFLYKLFPCDTFIDNITNFMTGYKKFISLTDEEIKVIPYLIMLRRLDVIIHFLVRYNKGINNSHITADKVLRGQLIKGRRLCVWVEENIEQIRKILK